MEMLGAIRVVSVVGSVVGIIVWMVGTEVGSGEVFTSFLSKIPFPVSLPFPLIVPFALMVVFMRYLSLDIFLYILL